MTLLIRTKLLGGNLIHNIMKLMSATIIAQVISFVFSPFLTRLYTPEEYGILTLFTTLVAILISFATGRYEIAIVLPEKDKDSKALLYGAFIYLITMVLFILLIILFFHDQIITLIGNKDFDLWLYVVPLSILIYGLYQNFNYWNNRYKNYSTIAFGRITEASSINLLQLIFGFVKLGHKGLILGYILGQLFAVAVFTLGGRRSFKKSDRVTIKDLKKQLTKYKEYPFYNMPSGFLDILSLQLPNLLISKFYGAASLGFFSLTLRIVNAPLIFISASISQVYYQRLNEMYLKGQKLKGFILKVAGLLSIISLIPFFVLFFFGPDLFAFIFGSEWMLSGELAKIMAFALSIRLVVSPLSPAFFVFNRVKLLFVLQTCRFITTTITLLIAKKFSFSIFIIIYTVHDSLFYIVYFFLIIYISSSQESKVNEY